MDQIKQNLHIILVGFVSGFLGILVAVSLVLWTSLPNHTVDLLTFTESAFGIGMTVLALIATLLISGERAKVVSLEARAKDMQAQIQNLSVRTGVYTNRLDAIEELQQRYGWKS